MYTEPPQRLTTTGTACSGTAALWWNMSLSWLATTTGAAVVVATTTAARPLQKVTSGHGERDAGKANYHMDVYQPLCW